MEKEGIETEVFLVMQNRNASSNIFPGIEKTSYMKIHWTEREAQTMLDKAVEEIGPYYGVYKAIIKVTEKI